MAKNLAADTRARAAREKLLRPRTWRWAFQRLQQKGREGALTHDAWAQAIKEAGGVRVSRQELQKALQKFYRDGTGRLEYGEFEELLKALLDIPRGKVSGGGTAHPVVKEQITDAPAPFERRQPPELTQSPRSRVGCLQALPPRQHHTAARSPAAEPLRLTLALMGLDEP